MDEMFAVKCLEGESTQRVFECPFCGNKIGVADLLKPGTFNKRLTMGIDAEYVTEQGIPCEISPQQAHVNALHEAFCQVLLELLTQGTMLLKTAPRTIRRWLRVLRSSLESF